MSPCVGKGDGKTIMQFNVSQIGNIWLVARPQDLTREWWNPCADPLPSARKKGQERVFQQSFCNLSNATVSVEARKSEAMTRNAVKK